MTFAYRKDFVASKRDMNAKDDAELSQRLDSLQLIKQHCEKLGKMRYRCEAVVMMDAHRVEGFPAQGNAIYTYDSKGWQFAATVKE